jgi:hypothetical protein
MAGERNLAVVVTANLKQMRDEMAKADAIIATTSGALNRMSNSYSGASTISQANAAMQAVRDVGGVTKLTDSEQRRLNATLQEGIAKYTALGQQAPGDMVKLEEATRKAQVATQQASEEIAKQPGLMDKINARAVALGAAIGSFLGNMAWSAVNKLGAEIGVFAEQGMKLNAVRSSFERLASGMDVDSRKMLAGMQTASRGLVSEYELMQSANKAMLLGLPVTAESMHTLTDAATTLGRAMGMTATKSVDDLITALGRSSPMILDNLGITVKVGEANELYAQKLGIVGRELTDAEKKIAFYEAAMQKALDKTKELGDQTETLGEIGTRVWTSFGDIVTTLVSDFNVGIGSILSNTMSLGTMFKAFDEFGVVGGLRFIATLERGKSAVGELTAEEKNYVDRLLGEGVPAWRMAELGLNRTVASIQAYINSLKPAAEDTEELTAEQIAAAKAAADLAAKFQAQVDVLTGKALAREVAELARQIKQAGKEGGISAHQMGLIGKKLSEMQQAGATLEPELANIARQFELTNIKALPVVTTFQSLASILGRVKGEALAAAPSVAQLRLEMQGFARDYQQMSLPGVSLADNIKRYFAGVDAAAGETGENAAEAVASGFANTTAAWESIGDTIVGAIMGGGSVGRAVGASIGGGIGKDIGAAIATSIGGTLGKAIGSFAGPLGAALGGAIGGAVSNLFGGNDTKKERERAAQVLGFSNADALYRELRSLGSEGAALANQALNLIGKKDVAANQQWITSVTNLLNKQSESLAKQQEAARELIPSWREAAALAEKYGITLEEIDAAVRQGELTELATTLYKDFERLAAFLGGEVNEGVLRGMSDEFSGLIGQALEFGLEIPNELRPVIERMREMGLLVDANGAAFTDAELDGLNFADTMEAATRDLIAVMRELVDTLKNGVAGAIESVGGAMRGLPSSLDFDVRPNFGAGREPAFAGAFAEGGTVVANRPTFALFGEAGPERATFTPMGRGASSSGGGGGDQTIVVQVSEEVILRKVVRGMPRYLKLIGAQ